MRVHGPGGVVINFPDGTDAATVDRVMREATQQQAPQEPPAFSGSILPFSRGQDGQTRFDSNAGVLGLGKEMLGAAKDAFSLPGDVYAGQVDPRSDEAIGRSFNLASLASPLNPGIRAGEGWAGAQLPSRTRPVKPPTSQELIEAGGRGFDQMRDMGVDYSSAAVSGMASKLRTELERQGLTDRNAKGTYEILRLLESPPAGSVAPLSGLDQARRELQEIAIDQAGGPDRKAAARALAGLEKFIQKPDPESVVAGPASAASGVLRDARRNYAAGKRSETLQGIDESAEFKAAVAHSGQGLDNAIRRGAAFILDPKHPERRRGFSKEELKAVTRVAMGDKTENTIRFVANLLGGGGGLGMAVVGGGTGLFAGGALLGATVAGSGLAAKKASGALSKYRLRVADELVRSRSPLYERMMQEATAEPTPVLRRAAMNRALILMHQEQEFERKRRAGLAT